MEPGDKETALSLNTARTAQTELRSMAAFVFDMDGVITNTAKVHARAWKRLFDEHFAERAKWSGTTDRPFDITSDYRTYVDGKPRYDGVDSFLRSRGIVLEWGDRSDPPDRITVCGLGNRKNGYFLADLRNSRVAPLPTVVQTLVSLRAAGRRVAVISASRNARQVLEAARVSRLFDTIVDGADSEGLGLAGKPAPDIFLEAARQLGVSPRFTAVVEDSIAGVEAGKRGGFAVVIGVGTGDHARELLERGAHMVITRLSEIIAAVPDTRTEGDRG